jgi:hypothetical protein
MEADFVKEVCESYHCSHSAQPRPNRNALFHIGAQYDELESGEDVRIAERLEHRRELVAITKATTAIEKESEAVQALLRREIDKTTRLQAAQGHRLP